MIRIPKGNDFTMRIPVKKSVNGKLEAFPLPACTDISVRLCNGYRRYALSFSIDVAEDHVLLSRVEGDHLGLGVYALEVRGRIFGNDWRSNEYQQIQIVGDNTSADYEFMETDGEKSVDMDTAIVILPPSVETFEMISDLKEGLEDLSLFKEVLENQQEAITALGLRVDNLASVLITMEEYRAISPKLFQTYYVARDETDKAKMKCWRIYLRNQLIGEFESSGKLTMPKFPMRFPFRFA